jgi:hypothetical protein
LRIYKDENNTRKRKALSARKRRRSVRERGSADQSDTKVQKGRQTLITWQPGFQIGIKGLISA